MVEFIKIKGTIRKSSEDGKERIALVFGDKDEFPEVALPYTDAKEYHDFYSAVIDYITHKATFMTFYVENIPNERLMKMAEDAIEKIHAWIQVRVFVLKEGIDYVNYFEGKGVYAKYGPKHVFPLGTPDIIVKFNFWMKLK